jgi:hypothetical protein
MKTQKEIEIEIACEEAKIPMLEKQLSEYNTKGDFGGITITKQGIDSVKTKINVLKWVLEK